MNLNSKTFRILQCAPRDTRVTDLYINYNTLTLPSLHKFNNLLFVHKYFHHPDQFFLHLDLIGPISKILKFIFKTLALKISHIQNQCYISYGINFSNSFS